MVQVIAVANNKGGVSKTTTACNVAYCMAERGEKVLLVDMDSQANTTRTYGIFPGDYSICMYHLLLNQIMLMLGQRPKYGVSEAIIKSKYGPDVIPCDARISDIPTWLQDHAAKLKGPDIQRYWQTKFPYFLHAILADIKGDYDRIIIDTPPAFEYHTKASIIASDYIIIPVELGDLELAGIESLLQKITGFNQEYACKASILGIIVNRYDWGKKGSRTVVERDLEAQLRTHPGFGGLVFDSIIYRNTAIREAAVLGRLAVTYEKRNARSVKDNYNQFVEEIETWLARREVPSDGQ